MRVIAIKTLRGYLRKFSDAEQSILSWFKELEAAYWNTPNELKDQFQNASIINNQRVVFNIHGNKYRLIVDIEYRLKIIFIVWFGTHKQYDKIDAKKINYVETHKK
jgi:mRNA interferase HigB